MTTPDTPDPQDIERAVAATAPDPGELFARAIFASFFHQPVIGVFPGMDSSPLVINRGQSPVQQVANELWQRHGEWAKVEIVRTIHVEDVIERIAERVYQRLTDESEQDDRYSRRGRDLAPAFADVQRIVREKLAEKLSERQMAAYDAEQSEMRAAWQREQERMRTAPAELESGEQDEAAQS